MYVKIVQRLKRIMKMLALDAGTRDVFTLPRSSTIMTALRTMINRGFRRIPIADAGTKRLEGIISATDFINLFGGGKKFDFVKNRHSGNLAAAVNAEIEEIMEKKVIAISDSATFSEAVETMFEKRVGGCPIINDDGKVVGIITEKDVVKYLANKSKYDAPAEDYMTKNVVTLKPRDTIKKAMETMISKKLRRLPVVDSGILYGIVTVREILNYFGKGHAFRMLTSGNIVDATEKNITVLLSGDRVYYREVPTFQKDTPISHIVKSFIEKGYGAALIVENNQLEGIITERDIVRFMYEHL
ncbi:MAG: CBS domain-containing protein [Archaeoglobaceae archaeon]